MALSKNRTEKALDLFKVGFSCSQAVLGAFGDDLGLDNELALKISDPFGGGMKYGSTCGAVCGALMAIGLKFGRTMPKDEVHMKRTNEAVALFLKRFKEASGGEIDCLKLLNCDINTPEGKEYRKQHNLRVKVCEKAIKDATDIVVEILSPNIGEVDRQI